MSLAYNIEGKTYLWRGKSTHKIPTMLYVENRERLCQRLRGNLRTPANAYVYLEGAKKTPAFDTESYYPFQQESFFMWTFGIQMPDLCGIIEVRTGETYLFIPEIPERVWGNQSYDIADYKTAFQLKYVYYNCQLESFLDRLHSSAVLLTLSPQNRLLKLYPVKENLLYKELAECRVHKSNVELEIFRYVSQVASKAIQVVMVNTKPGMMEYECEAEFKKCILKEGGCVSTIHPCICASGPNTAIFHSENIPNNRRIKNGDLCLFSMSATYFGYPTQITCTFPANGLFTNRQKLIYNAVLDSRNAVLSILKAGQSFASMHMVSNQTLLTCLREIGILKGEVTDMLKRDVVAYFQPHGLGHFLGLDIYDVGGYPDDYPLRPEGRSFEGLRTARVLQAGMLVTVGPGCYFIDKLLVEAQEQVGEFIDGSVLKEYKHLGGVRIEDLVYVMKDGNEVLFETFKSVGKIEEFMKRPMKDDFKPCECPKPQENNF